MFVGNVILNEGDEKGKMSIMQMRRKYRPDILRILTAAIDDLQRGVRGCCAGVGVGPPAEPRNPTAPAAGGSAPPPSSPGREGRLGWDASRPRSGAAATATGRTASSDRDGGAHGRVPASLRSLVGAHPPAYGGCAPGEARQSDGWRHRALSVRKKGVNCQAGPACPSPCP